MSESVNMKAHDFKSRKAAEKKKLVKCVNKINETIE